MTSPNSPGPLDRLRKFDPTVLPIIVAAVVLVGAVVWLVGRPVPQANAPDPRLAELSQRIAALEGRAAPDLAAAEQRATTRAEALDRRIAALEGRTGPDLAPLREQLGTIAGRLAGLEGRTGPDLAPLESRLSALESRTGPDLAPLRQELAALGTRLGTLEGSLRDLAARPVTDQDAARRGALDQLAQAVQGLAQQTQQRLAALDQALGAQGGRVAAAESGLAARAQAGDALATRLGALEQQVGQRIGAVEQQATARAAALEQALSQRGQAIEQQAQRLAALENERQRLAALEGRAVRMAALDQLRSALDAGRPLGGPLGQLPNPPEALARFAATPPPTEAQLRLAFEDAARAGRAASEPQAGGVAEGAIARLQGLVTVRRGEQVLWGDAAAAEIERARRAVDAGDIEAALGHLQKLSPPARQAMAGWIAQAEALVAARSALRQLSAG
ncbi:hypothetical protein [Falsiroseomonas sp. HW251]|uniref:COG4223 family protein n=1 Tax=Falsiroseomonas sp. HW251 TaxID=3390998 RepID=UPI003D321215